MIDKLSPLYARGIKPIPVIPTVYTDALSYGEQVGVMTHKIDECVDKVNEVVDDNNEFKTDLTEQQDTFETSISDQQDDFETNITNQQSSFETGITNQQNTYEQETTAGLNTWKTATQAAYQEQIDDMNDEWDNFIEEYQTIGDFMDTFGNNPIVGVSQQRLTSAIKGGEINGINPNNVNTNSENIDIEPKNFGIIAGYINSDGETVVTSTPHKHIVLNLHNVKLIKVRVTGAGAVPLVVLHGTNGYSVGVMANDAAFIDRAVNINCENYDTAYINIFDGVTYSVLQYAMNGLLSDNAYYPNFETYVKTFNKNELPLHLGYYTNSFEIRTATGDSHQHCILPSKGIKKITIPASSMAVDLPSIFVKYSNGTHKLAGKVLAEQHTYEFDSNGDYDICINFFEGNYFKTITVEYDNEDRLNDYIKNITTKNTAYTAFGDSIGVGYIDTTHTANPNALQTATTILNSTLDNQCVSGSSFVNVTGYPCIVTKIKNTTISTDTVLIFGGINDWQLGVNATDFASAIDDACSYLQGLGKTVIFITPINHCGRIPINRPQMSVKDVTNIIAENAIKYGFSVIVGMDFDMPTLNSSSTLKALLSEDNIHPTQAGYDLIGQTIGNKLKNA